MKSQVITYTNITGCDVIIGYEAHNNLPPNCATCGSGTLLISGGGSGSSGTICGSSDLCVWLLDVDGCSYQNNVAIGNHISNGICHAGLMPNYAVIVCSTAPNCPGQNVNIWLNGLSILIN